MLKILQEQLNEFCDKMNSQKRLNQIADQIQKNQISQSIIDKPIMFSDPVSNTNIATTSIMDKDVFILPKFLSQLQHITTVDTGGLQFIICCDKLKLYIFPLMQNGLKPIGTVHQSLPIPNIKSLRTIAKNFLMIQTQNRYLGIFEIIRSPHKQPLVGDHPSTSNTLQPTTVKVEFSQVLKWRIVSSYFIRQVMQNLFQVQVFFTDLQFQIFHFTNKNKRGSMSFTISQNGRILKSNKRQLYGSKFFFNIGRKLVYWMKSFSDKQFFLQEIVMQQPIGALRLEPFGYFGVQRAEEYKMLSTNLVVRDCLNPAKRHFLQIDGDSFLNDLKAQLATLSPSTKKKNPNQQQNPFHELVQRDGIAQLLQTYKLTIFTDLLMIENKQKKRMQIYQIRTEGSSIVGKEDSHVSLEKDDNSSLMDVRRWQWYFGNSKKLIAIDRIGFKLKYVQEMTLREKNNQQTVFEESSEITIPEQTKKQEQKQSIRPDSSQNEQDDELNKPQGRKFSKDELKKYLEEFDQNKSKEYIDENLKKKVDQTNNKSSPKLPQNTYQQVPSSQSETKKSEENDPIISKVEQNTNDFNGNQQPLKVKQKPPMKIIQKNKISVAKSFISQQQSELKQSNEIEKPKSPQGKQPVKQTQEKRQQVKAKQTFMELKQERKKVNVITRASLLKKKQSQSEQPRTQQIKRQEQNKTFSAEQIKTFVQEQTLEIQKVSVSQKKVESALENSEEKPKTRYIPSIDVRKASASLLNECEFLSEDSLSQEEEEKKTQSKPQVRHKKSLHEDEQIEEQIEGESGYTSQGQEEEDMEHLIDDDIEKKETPKEVPEVVKQEINHDEEIQKICNNLFEDKPSYKKNSVHSSQNIVVSKTSQLDRNVSKEQLNEINQLNSLLFKTNIKRTNIFGSEDKPQGEIKKEQNKIEDQNTSQVEKKIVEEKKIKVWHDLSSDSDDEKSSSENESDHKPQETNIQTKQQQNLPNEQLKISETLQKIKKVEQQCTKILSEIEDHKSKQIQQKLLEEKIQKQTESVEIITVKSQEIKYNPFLLDSKPKKEANIFVGQKSGLFPSNSFLSSQGLTFPSESASNWLFNKPSTQLTQNKDQNPFINFKKSLQDTQVNHHNLFGLGESKLFNNNFNEKLGKNQALKDESATNAFESPNEPVKKQEPKPSERIETQITQTKQVPSQSMIPTILLPKIQQLIASYQQSTISLLQKQQSSIIKSLQQIPNTHNPYNKNHSLLLPEQIKEEIIKQTKNTVKKWLATKMLDKIQTSFKEIMQQHKKVYEDALKYYQNEAKRRITTMQLQYEQQQTILMDIENVAANLSSALQGSILQGEQMHTFQIKEWKNEIQNLQTTLVQPLNQQIDDSKLFFTERNKNLQNLGSELSEIKEILKDKLKKKQELKELKEKKKLKIQAKLKEQQEKKAKKKEQQTKKSTQKKPKAQNETPQPQYYNQPPPHYGHYEHQYYSRPPYPYY